MKLCITAKAFFFTFSTFLFTCIQINPIYSQTTTVNYIAETKGIVLSVDDDGSITLNGGNLRPYRHIVLWGLVIKDLDGARKFLVGRRLDCKIVHELGPIPEADCMMYPQKNGDVLSSLEEMRGTVSVFDWMSDLGFASQECHEASEFYRVADDNGFFWHCGFHGTPHYRIGSYPD
jgi:hypothetical protein